MASYYHRRLSAWARSFHTKSTCIYNHGQQKPTSSNKHQRLRSAFRSRALPIASPLRRLLRILGRRRPNASARFLLPRSNILLTSAANGPLFTPGSPRATREIQPQSIHMSLERSLAQFAVHAPGSGDATRSARSALSYASANRWLRAAEWRRASGAERLERRRRAQQATLVEQAAQKACERLIMILRHWRVSCHDWDRHKPFFLSFCARRRFAARHSLLFFSSRIVPQNDQNALVASVISADGLSKRRFPIGACNQLRRGKNIVHP